MQSEDPCSAVGKIGHTLRNHQKKPLDHFIQGTRLLSVAAVECNFRNGALPKKII